MVDLFVEPFIGDGRRNVSNGHWRSPPLRRRMSCSRSRIVDALRGAATRMALEWAGGRLLDQNGGSQGFSGMRGRAPLRSHHPLKEVVHRDDRSASFGGHLHFPFSKPSPPIVGGERPTCRLKARLNATFDSYPTFSAIRAMVSSPPRAGRWRGDAPASEIPNGDSPRAG